MALTFDRNLYRSDISGMLESGVNPDNIFDDGLIYTITGSGFGARSGYTDHIKNSPIMKLPDDSNFDAVGRWNGGSFAGAGIRYKVVSEGINGKCLKAFRNGAGTPNMTLLFNYDAPVPLGSKVFTSVWVRHTTNATLGGQIKYSRWQKSTTSLSDKASEAYWNANNNSGDNKVQIRDYRGVGELYESQFGSANVNYWPHSRDKWVRMDMLHTLPSAYNLRSDYKCEGWVHDPDGAVPPYYTNFTDNQAIEQVSPYGQAGDEWLCHLFQFYLGNGDYDSANHVIRLDNCYQSVGDFKHVEIANSNNYATATRRFILPEVSWSNETIQVRADTYDIPEGSRYVHTVVNGVSTSVRAV